MWIAHWHKQLPILMSWVRPNLEILPQPSTNAANLLFHELDVIIFDTSYVLLTSLE